MGWDYYDYPEFGDCDEFCICSCEPDIEYSSDKCDPPTCLYLNASPTEGDEPLEVTLTGSGQCESGIGMTIDYYQLDFNGDGIWDYGDSINPPQEEPVISYDHTYFDGEYCAKFRVQNNYGAWSETPDDCPAVCTQLITVEPLNYPPTAQISCDPVGCTGYTGEPFTLINESTDPNGIDDIATSTWDIYDWGVEPDDSCVYCNFTPSGLSAYNYTVKLEVEDMAGASDLATKDFTILQDAIADFDCSLKSEGPWQDCEGFRASEGEVVYFKDMSSVSQGAASIIKRDWSFEDGSPFEDVGNNATMTSASFTADDAGSGTVCLDIEDSAGRTAEEEYHLQITVPLPEWQEVPPLQSLLNLKNRILGMVASIKDLIIGT